MVCKVTSTRRQRAGGFTIPEFLVASVIAVLLMASVMAFWLSSASGFAATLNYVEMNNSSKSALETLCQELRGAQRLKTYATQDVTLVGSDGSDVQLTYNATNKTLVRIKNTVSRTLLTGCDSLTFSIYQRNATAGTYDQYPAADAASCKVMQVQWTCSRALVGARTSTESARSAKIVMRNQ